MRSSTSPARMRPQLIWVSIWMCSVWHDSTHTCVTWFNSPQPRARAPGTSRATHMCSVWICAVCDMTQVMSMGYDSTHLVLCAVLQLIWVMSYEQCVTWRSWYQWSITRLTACYVQHVATYVCSVWHDSGHIYGIWLNSTHMGWLRSGGSIKL